MRHAIGVAILALAVAAAAGASRDGWRWRLPDGVAPPPLPADNAMSAARIALGRRLFYDADLSADGTMACATCHEQHRGFADGNRTRPGVHGDPGRRNVPGLANVAWLTPLTWADPKLGTLEAQASVPVLGDDPVEMGMKGREAELAGRLSRDRCYRTMFSTAFPESDGRIDMVAVGKALAAFERTMISFDSSYDRYRRTGAPLPPEAMRGAALFARSCASCHDGPAFSDGGFHRIATATDAADRGLIAKTGKAKDAGRFRTAGLRNAALGAPYLHDGSAATLPEAIRRHDALPAVAALDAAQRDDLASLIVQLNDPAFLTDRRLARPDEACGRPL